MSCEEEDVLQRVCDIVPHTEAIHQCPRSPIRERETARQRETASERAREIEGERERVCVLCVCVCVCVCSRGGRHCHMRLRIHVCTGRSRGGGHEPHESLTSPQVSHEEEDTCHEDEDACVYRAFKRRSASTPREPATYGNLGIWRRRSRTRRKRRIISPSCQYHMRRRILVI